MEHDEQSERLEHEADRMEQESDRIGERIDETRREWESKEHDPSVPGARPEPGEEEESVPGVSGEEETATGNPSVDEEDTA